MTYSIVEFAKSLQVDRCKVRQTPDVIFLCGGSTATSGKYLSARDFFNRYLLEEKPELASRVKLAEQIARWFHKDDAFSDLLELENYLAHLADAVVLFVESPGSIAELGAFAASEELRPKTIAVLNTSYGTDGSFIADGPVRKLKNANSDQVFYYTWDPKKLNVQPTRKEFSDISIALTEVLEQRHASKKKQLSFKTEHPGHSLLLVLDLIRIAGVATKSDLMACLKAIGCESASKALSEHLSILQSVGFVIRRLRSNQAFYVSDSKTAFIRYAYREDAVLKDLQRIRTEIRQNLDGTRKAVLRVFLAKVGSSG